MAVTGHVAALEESEARARRAQRRAVLKQVHPDLGGTPEAFQRVLACTTTTSPRPAHRGDAGGATGELVVVGSVRGRVRQAGHRALIATRTARNHLPRRLPGARREITL